MYIYSGANKVKTYNLTHNLTKIDGEMVANEVKLEEGMKQPLSNSVLTRMIEDNMGSLDKIGIIRFVENTPYSRGFVRASRFYSLKDDNSLTTSYSHKGIESIMEYAHGKPLFLVGGDKGIVVSDGSFDIEDVVHKSLPDIEINEKIVSGAEEVHKLLQKKLCKKV